MVSTSSSAPRSGVWYFSQGWKLVSLPGIRRFVVLPLLINIILMGAVHQTGKLDPFPDELCAGLVTVVGLPALADCGYLRAAGFRLFLFDDS